MKDTIEQEEVNDLMREAGITDDDFSTQTKTSLLPKKSEQPKGVEQPSATSLLTQEDIDKLLGEESSPSDSN